MIKSIRKTSMMMFTVGENVKENGKVARTLKEGVKFRNVSMAVKKSRHESRQVSERSRETRKETDSKAKREAKDRERSRKGKRGRSRGTDICREKNGRKEKRNQEN